MQVGIRRTRNDLSLSRILTFLLLVLFCRQNAVLVGLTDCCGRVDGLEFLVDVFHMVDDGVGADAELVGNLFFDLPTGEQGEDLNFSIGEWYSWLRAGERVLQGI